MDTATFKALPVTTHAAAVAGGVAIGSNYITKDLQGQTGKRVSYFTRITKIRENATYVKNMPRTRKPIRGWELGSNPASRTVSGSDPFTGAPYTKVITITASGSWPDGAVSYETSAATVSASVMPDFLPGTSQQTDGYVRIYDVLTD